MDVGIMYSCSSKLSVKEGAYVEKEKIFFPSTLLSSWLKPSVIKDQQEKGKQKTINMQTSYIHGRY